MGRDDRQWIVRSFILDSFDAAGNRQPPVSVQMRGLRFRGSINEGDRVRISKSTRAEGLIEALELQNLTTGSTVKALSRSAKVPGWVWNLIWIAVIILVIYLIFSGAQ
jgi:hypothetical protein